MNPVNETELGREVRTEVARILKRFGDNDIAAVKVSTLRKIDQLINPEPEVFDITAHQLAPSRDNPLAAAFAINARKAVRFEAPEQMGA